MPPLREAYERDLTPREREAWRLLAQGLLIKEVAAKMGIAYATAKIHTGSLLRGINVRNRVEAALLWHGINLRGNQNAENRNRSCR